MGACKAEMADDAVGPDVAELTGCGLAVDMPVAGSALPGGQSPRVGFFRAAQLFASVPGACTAPFVWGCCDGCDGADMVLVEDAVEARDEDEFWRWAVLRGPGVNILLTSCSDMVAPKPLPLVVHPILVLG